MKGQQRCFGNPEIMNYWKQLQPFGLVEQLGRCAKNCSTWERGPSTSATCQRGGGGLAVGGRR